MGFFTRATTMASDKKSCWESMHDTSQDSELIQVSEPESGIFVVNLNSPENHNMLTPLLMGALARKIDFLTAMEPESIKCIIITAAGTSFCCGVDINAIQADAHFENYWTRVVDPFLAIQEATVPTISCVHGAALTGGFEIAVSADIALASRNAVFRDNHAMYGVLHLRGLSQILTRICGPSNAKLASLASLPITAERALSWQIVSEVVEKPEDLLPAAMQIARGIAYNSDLAVRALKGSMNSGFAISYAEARDLEISAEAEYFKSLGKARDKIMYRGSARFNERVEEIGTPEGMKGGMADIY